MQRSLLGALVTFLAPLFFAPLIVSAHEVYVLPSSVQAAALHSQAFDMIQTLQDNLGQFAFWTFIAFLVVSTVFFVSIFRSLEQVLDPLFERAKKYAPMIARVTVGLGLLAGAYYQASYGPELPLAPAWGAFTPIITAIMVAISISLIAGFRTRAAAFAALVLFAFATWRNGVYMLTYVNYFGEFVALLLIGPFKRYEFLIIRVAFGVSLLYAALYAKILHNNLALAVATLPLAGHPYGLAHYLGFEPHFLVLGASIIEILIAAFFIFGIEIRWTCIFLEFWLALSLWWFGESVWPHLILIGIPIALLLWGYDDYSIEGRFFKKRGWLAPVL